MKLKKAAKKAAKEADVNWIAADPDLSIYGYCQEPCREPSTFESSLDGDYMYIGNYTGNKPWNKTLRRVK